MVVSPTRRAQIINPEFLNWVQTELIYSLDDDPKTEYIPIRPLVSDDQWLLPFINDQLQSISDEKTSNHETLYHFGFEQEFDCSETNCVMHSHWSFHFRPVKRSQLLTISDLNDFQQLRSEISDALQHFLHSRFPSLIFTEETLLNSHLDPTIQISS